MTYFYAEEHPIWNMIIAGGMVDDDIPVETSFDSNDPKFIKESDNISPIKKGRVIIMAMIFKL